MAAKLVDQPLEFFEVEAEHPADQAERINIFALVASRAADRLNRQAGDGDPNADIYQATPRSAQRGRRRKQTASRRLLMFS